jgi:hypothetical protein
MGSGADRRDESISFSLRELTNLEQARVDEERIARDVLAAREREARLESERALVRARAEQERLEHDERERIRRQHAEEEARLEALSRAAVEQARLAVEVGARAEEAERERRHERELAELAIRHKTPSRILLGGVCVLVGVAVGLVPCVLLRAGYEASRADERTLANTREEALANRLRASDARAENATREFDTLRAEGAALRGEVAGLQSKLKSVSLTEAGKVWACPPGKAPTARPVAVGTKPATVDPCAGSRDPLCGLPLN